MGHKKRKIVKLPSNNMGVYFTDTKIFSKWDKKKEILN